jgi:UDP-N-acetylglucosamine--N-acetylmuramyl-(pentapeptide) pyrophosphoryl-undecaprenol N-acetylglucosamine transferase
VLHVKGPKGEVVLPELPAGGPAYVVVDYVDRMDLAYAAADAMVGRSGSNSVTESAAVGLPCVFVPLPIGNGEQELNAKAVVDAGGALLVTDDAFTPDWVREQLPELVTDTARLATMSTAASGLIRRDADERLAAMILDAARQGSRRPR